MARQVLENKMMYENRQIAVGSIDGQRSEIAVGSIDGPGLERVVDNGQRQLEEALAESLSNYDRHRRSEVVLAAMYLMPADREEFWGGLLQSPGEVERVVRQLMVRLDEPELAEFCLSALKYPLLRMTAVRAISVHCRNEFIIALARNFSRLDDEQVSDGLKLVEKPAWLTPEKLPLHKCHEADQMLLVDFVMALGVACGQVGEYFCGCMEDVSEAVAQKIVAVLTHKAGMEIVGSLRRMLGGRYEKIAGMAMDRLIKLRPEGLPEIVACELRSPHKCVREAAEQYYQKFAFRLYWNNFESLSAEHRVAGAQAVFKIDPGADQRWRSYAMSDRPAERLRAIHISRILHLAGRHEDILHRLAGDKDCMVRSYAVAALGELGDELSHAGKLVLLAALKDDDGRVRANAVEALGHCREDEACAAVEPFAYSDNNRVRANAVVALLKWKVGTAGQAIKDMCDDGRPKHRVSGRWVLERNQEIIRQLRAGSEQKGADVRIAV